MKPTKIIFIILIALGMAFLSRCKKEEENPCLCNDAVPISADFKIETPLYLSYKDEYLWYEADTIWSGAPKRFVAQHQNTQQNMSYYWEIDNEDNSSTDPNYYLQYFPGEQWFDVTLEVDGNPRLDCYPTDGSADTLTKSFYTAIRDLDNGFSTPNSVAGWYEYNWGGTVDTMYIKMHEIVQDGWPYFGEIPVTHNFPPGCYTDTSEYTSQYYGFLGYGFHGWSLNCDNASEECCYGLQGYMIYDNNNINGEFRQRDTTEAINSSQPYGPMKSVSAHRIYPL